MISAGARPSVSSMSNCSFGKRKIPAPAQSRNDPPAALQPRGVFRRAPQGLTTLACTARSMSKSPHLGSVFGLAIGSIPHSTASGDSTVHAHDRPGSTRSMPYSTAISASARPRPGSLPLNAVSQQSKTRFVQPMNSTRRGIVSCKSVPGQSRGIQHNTSRRPVSQSAVIRSPQVAPCAVIGQLRGLNTSGLHPLNRLPAAQQSTLLPAAQQSTLLQPHSIMSQRNSAFSGPTKHGRGAMNLHS